MSVLQDGLLCFTVNGTPQRLAAAPGASLLHVLRNDLCLNGPKFGCGLGECGACAVLVDGHAVRACVVPAVRAAGRTVTTLEGLATTGGLHPIQQAFIDAQAAQCGYCLNGMIMAAKALLDRNAQPSEAEIREALRYHLCRCGTHVEILRAVALAAQYLRAAHPPVAAAGEGA
jgi:nicotinate dehydrogenase subunit A